VRLTASLFEGFKLDDNFIPRRDTIRPDFSGQSEYGSVLSVGGKAMTYISPKDAVAPRGSWRLEDVLIDQGESPPDGQPAKFSMATGYWEETPCLAIRWNGYEGSGVGYPQTIGHATWFILPTEVNRPMLAMIPPETRHKAETFLKIDKATVTPEPNRVAFPPRKK